MSAKYGHANPSCAGSRCRLCPAQARQRHSPASEKHRPIPRDRRVSKNRAASRIRMGETLRGVLYRQANRKRISVSMEKAGIAARWCLIVQLLGITVFVTILLPCSTNIQLPNYNETSQADRYSRQKQ